MFSKTGKEAVLPYFANPNTLNVLTDEANALNKPFLDCSGSFHKRQKPQAPIRNRQTRKVANAKGLNCNTNLT